MAKRKSKQPRLSHPLDVALGARIREVRQSLHPRVTQDWLARECSCAVTQIQKYETGENRVSFSRLVEICDALGVSVSAMIAPVLKSR